MSRTTRQMLQLAAWCVVAFAALMSLAYYVGPAQWLDAAALHGFVSAAHPFVADVATALAHFCDPFPYALVAALVIAVALKTRGLRIAAAIGFMIAGANFSSQLLKPALAYHRELYYTEFHLNNINNASFPSGHATAAMTLALGVLMIVPRAYRPVTAALGALFTIAVSFSILVLAWHFPSDVVGGYLVATTWGLTALAGLRYVNERWPQRGTVREAAKNAIVPPSPATLVKLTLFLIAVATGIAASRADQIAGFADRHTAMVAVASAIVVAATLLLAAVAIVSGSGRRSS